MCLADTPAPRQELRAAESLRRIKLDPPLLACVPCEFEWERMKRANFKMPLWEFQRPKMRHYILVGVTGGIDDIVLAVLREGDAIIELSLMGRRTAIRIGLEDVEKAA